MKKPCWQQVARVHQVDFEHENTKLFPRVSRLEWNIGRFPYVFFSSPFSASYLLGGAIVTTTLRLRHHKRRITLSGLAWLGDPLSTYWGKPKLYGKTHEKNWVKKIELAGGQREGGILWTKQQIGKTFWKTCQDEQSGLMSNLAELY